MCFCIYFELCGQQDLVEDWMWCMRERNELRVSSSFRLNKSRNRAPIKLDGIVFRGNNLGDIRSLVLDV